MAMTEHHKPESSRAENKARHLLSHAAWPADRGGQISYELHVAETAAAWDANCCPAGPALS